jgi:hypothetical protein
MSAMPAPAEKSVQGAFSIRIILGLVVVGVVSFAAFIVLSAFADDLRSPLEGGAHAESKSAIGFAGLVELLQKEGRRVRMARGSLYEAGGHQELGVLTPPLGAKLDWSTVYESPGVLLIILPKWTTYPDQTHPGWVSSNGPAPVETIRKALEEIAPDLDIKRFGGTRSLTLKNVETGAGVPIGPIDMLQVIEDEAFTPILSDIEGRAVLGA